MSSLPKMAVGFCPVGFCPVGFCPSGVLSQWGFVRSPADILAVLMSPHNQCFRAKIRKIMYTRVHPSFTIYKCRPPPPSSQKRKMTIKIMSAKFRKTFNVICIIFGSPEPKARGELIVYLLSRCRSVCILPVVFLYIH